MLGSKINQKSKPGLAERWRLGHNPPHEMGHSLSVSVPTFYGWRVAQRSSTEGINGQTYPCGSVMQVQNAYEIRSSDFDSVCCRDPAVRAEYRGCFDGHRFRWNLVGYGEWPRVQKP